MPLATAARPLRRSIHSGRFGRFAAIVVTILTACIAAPAEAQPGDGMPKPITAREINDYARILGLTPMQRAGIDPVHDAYKADHQRLRTTLIEPWMEKQQMMNRGGPSVTRDAVKELLDDQAMILTRVAALDARFFDQLVPLLTPDQLAMLPRVRLARERTRSLSSGLSMAFGGAPSDLSMQISQADLAIDLDAKTTLDAILVPYERRLTKRMVELDDASRSMIFAMIEAMDEAGLLGMTQEEMMSDPEQMRAAMEVAQRAFSEAGAEARGIGAEIAELNGKTYAQLMRAMPPLVALRIREIHVGTAGGGRLVSAAPSRPWAMALGIEDLEPGIREQLEAGLRSTMASEESVISDTLESMASMRANIDPMNFDPTMFEAFEEEMAETVEQLETRQEAAVQQVAALVGDEWESRLRRSDTDQVEISQGGVVTRSTANDSPFQSVPTARPETGGRVDEFVPGRITSRTVRRLAQRLELGEGDRSILELMHEEYVAAFRNLPSRDRLSKAVQARYVVEEDGDDPDTRTRTLLAARRAARAEIAGLDEQFFDDVDATLGVTDEAARLIERERLLRRREHAIGVGTGQSWTTRGGSAAGDVDLAVLVRGLDLSAADRETAEAALDPWLERTVAIGDRLVDARFAFETAQTKWQQRLMQDTRESGPDALAVQASYQEILEGPSKRIEAIRAELAEFNRTGYASLQAAVSADARAAIKQAWDRATYPAIYDDPICVVPHLERALDLESLDAAQRDELRALLGTYRADWQRLSDEIAGRLGETTVNFATWQEVDWVEVQQLERELQELGMERSEGSIRTANRLRLILTADQLAAIGGLPDPDDEASFSLFSGMGF